MGNFNSRPHGGRRRYKEMTISIEIFQLTPSRRATTGTPASCHPVMQFQLTPSRRATSTGHRFGQKRKFQLTPSRRATKRAFADLHVECISTHALTEGDSSLSSISIISISFQLTPSRRATMSDVINADVTMSFQLTPSRRATDVVVLTFTA